MSKAMTFRHDWVLAVGADENLSTAARLLAVMAIMEFGKPDEGEALWPSHESLGGLIGTSDRTARRRMKEVVDAGWISMTSGRNTGGSNTYLPVMRMATIGQPAAPESENEVGHVVSIGGPDLATQVGQVGSLGRPMLTDEQTQEHPHQQTHEEQASGHALVEPIIFARPSDYEPDTATWQPIGDEMESLMEMCEWHTSFAMDNCEPCQRPPIVSTLPVQKQAELYAGQMRANENLDDYGDPLSKGLRHSRPTKRSIG